MTPCSLVVYQRFLWTCCLYPRNHSLTLKTEVTHSFEVSAKCTKLHGVTSQDPVTATPNLYRHISISVFSASDWHLLVAGSQDIVACAVSMEWQSTHVSFLRVNLYCQSTFYEDSHKEISLIRISIMIGIYHLAWLVIHQRTPSTEISSEQKRIHEDERTNELL
jgi:hypothetical protein